MCGCDGVTYPTLCLAQAAGQSSERLALCSVVRGNTDCSANADCPMGEYCYRPDDSCGAAGTCAARTTNCGTFIDRVCGCDGVTYNNICPRRAGRSELDHSARRDCASLDASTGDGSADGAPGDTLAQDGSTDSADAATDGAAIDTPNETDVPEVTDVTDATAPSDATDTPMDGAVPESDAGDAGDAGVEM